MPLGFAAWADDGAVTQSPAPLLRPLIAIANLVLFVRAVREAAGVSWDGWLQPQRR